MNVRGFWNKRNARQTKDQVTTLRTKPVPEAPQETWRSHPDREAIARAEKALCTKESHRDS
jgi:hypothetical protein